MTAPSPPNRFRLRRYFSIASGVLMLLVSLPMAYAYYRSEVQEHTRLAGERNAVLARTYANVLWPTFGAFLLNPGVPLSERQPHAETARLDTAFRQMAGDAPVIKIKVYNLEGIAVYSSVLREIGENKSQNSGYQSARHGMLVNELTHRGRMSATEGEIQNVDVVSSYIPIRLQSNGPVVAVFELYSNVTETVARIEHVTWQLLAGILAVFLLLYLSLLAIVARADAILGRQYEALRRSEALAASASRAKSEFLSAMSHELRTPMNAIIGFAQLLETEPDSPLSGHQQRFVRQILKAADHLLQLINQVLDLSRIEAGKMALSLEAVSLEDLMEEVQPLLQHLLQQHQVSPIKSELGGLMVKADYARLKQVLLNLTSNAIKYNRPQGQVRVIARQQGPSVRVEVRDTGPGIPAAQLGELFQPFNRLGVESADIEGTGIGLSLSQRLVQAMGGEIGVESTLGSGSTFWFTLPAHAGRETSANLGPTPPNPVLAPSQVHGDLARSMSILYIEDNPANVMLMGEIVQRLPGVQLRSAHNVETGMAMALEQRPDLVLMDIHLQGPDGYEGLRLLRQAPQTASIPVIALSAHALESDIARGVEAGFDAYYTKPVQVGPFSNTLMAMLENTAHGL
jgi:signal transduction histidine kinase/ActR/RegA family two-component response regulator